MLMEDSVGVPEGSSVTWGYTRVRRHRRKDDRVSGLLLAKGILTLCVEPAGMLLWA